ncbi:lamin tail domain-containing protein [Candidatus Woesearchaeota archaeon]|nr:lamin tail domain-containing protein [Candidatus Woesearchaeota archaeon]
MFERIAICVVSLILFAPFVSAEVYITEIMHSPEGISDSDGEWVEVYNDGNESVNMSGWTLNGKEFSSFILERNTYAVIARELLDGTDTDTESFEAYWGNNNGIWDENFLAVQGAMSLKSADTLVLSNGQYKDSVEYNSSFGGKDGKSIERVSPSLWKDGAVNGTPGFGNFSSVENVDKDIEVIVRGDAKAVLEGGALLDDSVRDGVQVLPHAGKARDIPFFASMNGSQGNISAFFQNKSIALERNGTQWLGNVSLLSTDAAGMYTIHLVSGNLSKDIVFSYLPLLANEVDTHALEFNSSSSAHAISVKNIGNIPFLVSVELSEGLQERLALYHAGTIFFRTVSVAAGNSTSIEMQMLEGVPEGLYQGKIHLHFEEQR